MSTQESRPGAASDADLLERAQSGDSHAFAELWRRHHRSAALVARQYTSSIEADDLVSEAYARIYQRVLAGGGPTGAFRPYLYTTIRNLASRWGKAQREVAVDELDDVVDARSEDPTDRALDRALTARAFRSLPERWQSVLWYTEIEGMDPHEVAPLLGLTPNGVAALSYRAREGLRVAWLQAHVSDVVPGGECEWTLAHLGGHARRGLRRREEARLATHLQDCARCSIVSEEVDEVGSRLAFVMLPLLLGAGVGGILLSQLAAPGAAVAASAVPAAGLATATGVTVGTASAGAAVGTPALVGAIALAAVIGGSVALGAATAPTSFTHPEAAAPAQVVDADGTDAGAAESAPSSGANDPANPLIDVVGGDPSRLSSLGPVQDAVDGALGALTPTDAPPGQLAPPGAPVSATIDLALSGQGTPGATVAAQVGGAVWATTTVASSGRWSLQLDAVPQSAGSVSLTQNTHGLLGGVLTPLTLDTGPLGFVVNLFG